MALRSSTKIAIGFAVISGGLFFGYRVITDQMVLNEKFTPLKPSTVNFVGIAPGAGYRIITANYMAQLVEASSAFENTGSDGGGATSGSIKRRIPVRELLQTLQGDTKALGAFIMALNDMKENDDWPTVRIVWTAEDLRKAIDGDAKLRARLEADLNMRLNGEPLPRLNFDSLENGIIIDSPVTIEVKIAGKPTMLTARVQEPYTPRMIRAVKELYKDKGDVTRAMQAGYYQQEARAVLADPKKREDIAKSLLDRISEKVAESRAEYPQRVLGSATIIVSDQFITGASYREYPGPTGKPFYDLTVRLNDEGRRRLWQFSKLNMGKQILLVTDGIPVAAPVIRQELAQNELTVTQMQDLNLVKDSVDSINNQVGQK